MQNERTGAATLFLQRAQQGDPTAAGELLPLVYQELRKLAAARMANETSSDTLQATALVHEAWLRVTVNDSNTQFANRAHFFSAAAEAMRRILVDRARRKSTGKRGGGWEKLDLDNVEVVADADGDTLLLVSEALDKLAREAPKAAEIVKLRFFVGLTIDQAGQLMGVTERTARRYWSYARAWLFEEMKRALNS